MPGRRRIPFKRQFRSAASSNIPEFGGDQILEVVDHTKMLAFIDIICGGYCFLMCGVCLYGWASGGSSYRPFVGIFSFVAFNLIFSEITRRITVSETLMEKVRSWIGPFVAAFAFAWTLELFHGWWMGFMIMCLGGNTLHTMVTQRPNRGRLLTVIYLVIFLGCVFVFAPETDKYQISLVSGAIAMTGILFAELLAQYSSLINSEHQNALEIDRQKRMVEQQSFIIEQKKQQELEKALEVDRVKSVFFTNISHEFRTPLTLIKGSIQNLLEQHAGEPRTRERLKLVQKNSDILLKLINQLLDLARLESGSIRIVNSTVELNSFLNITIQSFSALAIQKKIVLSMDLPAVPWLAGLDKEKIETILINLVGNAVKFTPEGGAVDVKAAVLPEMNRLVLSVTDTGIGIAPEEHQKIFERFYQVDNGGAHQEIGTGIGLSLVKELTELLNGTIEVTSAIASGSEFKVSLPVNLISLHEAPLTFAEPMELAAGLAPERGVFPEEIPALDRKPQLLVVEDNTDLRKFIVESFQQEYTFLEARDGSEGLQMAVREIPELIITDIMMPEMDGITLTGKLKRNFLTSHIPIIVLTAKATELDKLSGLQKGADDYLTKPFNKHELLLKVRNSISNRKKIREKVRIELLGDSAKTDVISDESQFLLKVREIIQEHRGEERLTVESLAKEIGVSRVQLYRKISALTGAPAIELIRTFRLQRAAQLLAQRWGPVSQVAYEVGFSNLSHFSKSFKARYGVLPSEYSL